MTNQLSPDRHPSS